MEKKNILILVRTEYQLLLAAQLIFAEFSDTNHYNIILIQHVWKGINRFKSAINSSALPVKYIVIEVDYKKSKCNKIMRQIIKELLTIHYYKFIYFMEQRALEYYFSDVLSRKGTIICLGQDGLKPYASVLHFDLHWRIIETYRIYAFLFSNKLFIKRFSLVSFKYAYLKCTDELLLTHPEAYNNWSKKKLIKINFDNDLQKINKLKKLFVFEKDQITLNDNSFFFVNQPNTNLFDYEIEFLNRIRNKFPEATIYIKIHPLTPKSQLILYNQISNCIIIDTSIPAELYISSLKNSIILSFWSTALLFHNKTCNYFWLYELILNEGIRYEKMCITNPTEHINIVKSFELIDFKSSIA